MTIAKDPFESYLTRAAELFESGDIVQAGQIWQAILKKNPNSEVARAGLYKVKLYFDARATQDGLAGAKPAPAPVLTPIINPEVDKLLEQGCTLYDAGHTEDALGRWEQALAIDPENALAKGYITRAKRAKELVADNSPRDTGVIHTPESTSETAPEPIPEVAPEPVAEVDIEKCLRDGCTLYDMGQMEDALRKWELVLSADPNHALARTYVRDARKDMGLPALEDGALPPTQVDPEPEAPAPALPVREDSEELDRILREGVQLYDMGMALEATGKWRQVLEVVPDHSDAIAYLAMAERDARNTMAPSGSASRPAAPVPAPVIIPPPISQPIAVSAPPTPVLDETPEPPATNPDSVAPPTALTKAATTSPRKGLELPKGLQSLSVPAWLASPKLILGLIVGLVILVVGSTAYRQWRKEVQLKEAVEASRAEALAPVARSVMVPSLADTPAAMLKEGQQAIGEEPLITYYRAQELLRVNSTDAAAAQLLEKAKAGLSTATSASVTLADYQRQTQEGDLDSAQRTIAQLLAQAPDDASLKDRAGRLYLALCQIHASKERWQDAADSLRRGRAMFPADKSWNARLKLLENLQNMSRGDRASWVQLLG